MRDDLDLATVGLGVGAVDIDVFTEQHVAGGLDQDASRRVALRFDATKE